MSATDVQIVTQKSIIEGVEYEACPGVRYQIARGVVAELREATEDVIEAFEDLQEQIKQESKKEQADTRAIRRLTCRQAAAALVVVEGQADLSRETGSMNFVVASRVVEDFFSASRERPNALTRSLLAMVQTMASQKDGDVPAQAETDVSSSGQSDSGSAAAAGPPAPSS